ncbi:hypothetical protein QBC34DRAFT_432002 [Podospora aff. communis PSN243]|uniref:Uncharacterized protein n=1 Tax=Podospora aff. communis PSN243 TaxID=3040156 RepID=A0AAV9G415_9PEZI|nr:hypothetical protein QBC34DRAFT_432002 [Podospora aff. communis PSN243]
MSSMLTGAESMPIGARSFAVSLTAWTNTPDGRKCWVQRRGWNKTLLPGMLDSAVSGRLQPDELPYEGMYVYEMELDQEHVLSCDTDDVAEFLLMSIEEVRDAIDRDEFIAITRLV